MFPRYNDTNLHEICIQNLIIQREKRSIGTSSVNSWLLPSIAVVVCEVQTRPTICHISHNVVAISAALIRSSRDRIPHHRVMVCPYHRSYDIYSSHLKADHSRSNYSRRLLPKSKSFPTNHF